MKKIIYAWFLLSFLLISKLEIVASHLIGGNLGYEYIGKVGNLYRYKIILTTYTDCTPASQIPDPEESIQDVGVYQHNVQNNPMGGTNKTFITSVSLTLMNPGGTLITPSLPGGCGVGAGSCIKKGIYQGFVNLAVSFNGYHLFYERCCRNAAITNLVPNESMSFHAYIPPPLIPNNSPKFTDNPIPFLCAGETSSILNSAYDIDGDLLTFSFVTPYDGFSNATNPAPVAPNPQLSWTLPTVTYATVFSTALPFGAAGSSTINASTGLTTYTPSASGNYVVAVEIREFRNGNLIGITRRDLQLLVLNCPVNPVPVLSPTLGTTQTQHTVEEGATLCFDYGYTDPNNNTQVTLTSSGAIFNASSTNPPATINSPVTGNGSAATQFCWTTACGQAQTLPYQFQTSAKDNGCPPKTANNVFQITVTPAAPPTVINGLQVSCLTTTQTYTTNLIAGATYNWSTTGGTIVSQNNNSVVIQWTNLGSNTVSVSATNQFGCNSAPIDLEVVVTPSPTVNAGIDNQICNGNTANLLGSTNANPGFTSSWTPVAIVSGGNTLSPIVKPTTTTNYVLTINIGNGCFATDTVKVIVNEPQVNAGNDAGVCTGESITLNGSGGASYLWSPAATLSNATSSNPIATPVITTSYILTIIDTLGCTASDTVTISVNEKPIVSAGADKGVCVSTSNGASVPTETLDGAGNGSVLWTPSLGLSSTTILNPVFNPTITTQYVITLTDLNGCVNTDSVLVTIFDAVPTDAGADTTICPGQSVTLGGAPSAVGANTTYLWSPAAFLNDATLPNPIASPTVTTVFYLVTNNDTCNGIDSVLITVNPLPTIQAGFDVAICIGNSTQLQASGGQSYTWQPNTTLSNLVISNPIATPITTTSYIVTGTDLIGCVNSDTVEITVNSLPTIDAGAAQNVCLNNSANLQATGGLSYSWSPSASLNDNTLSNPTATPTVSTMYTVVGTDANSCQNSDSVLITVNPLPTIAINGSSAICIGNSTTLTASGGVSYVWNAAASLSTLTAANPVASPSVSTTYTVTGTDASGCENTANFTLTVNSLPTITAGPDTTICLNQSTGLVASGGVSYVWNNAASLNNANISNPQATPTATTVYTVTGTDANSCKNTATVTVSINPLPIVTAGNAQAICTGKTAQLSASGANSFVWLPSSTLNNATSANPIASPTTTTTYTVTGTDGNLCTNSATIVVTVNALPTVSAGNDVAICIGKTTTLQASGAVTYSWSPVTDLSNTAISNPVSSTASTLTYTVLGTDANGCENTATVTVTVNALPTINAGNDVAICIGENTSLTASGGTSYIWSPATALSATTITSPTANPTTTQTYSVVGKDANGCENTASVTVTVNALPLVNAGNDVSICLGDVIGLTATGATNYVWSPANFLDNVLIATPSSSADTTTTYNVIGTDINGCKNTDTVTVNVFRIVTIPDQTICIGESVQLNVFGSPGVNFVWSPATGLSDATLQNPIASPLTTTTYTVSATDLAGCNDQDAVTITVNPLPQAQLNYDIVVACDGGYVNFENQSIGGVSYLWNFGNGATSTLENPTYTYGFSGAYSGTFTVTNIFGCEQTVPYNLTTAGFNDYFDIYIPNVFTPNGDGENDLYKIEVPGRIAECVTMSIYNRWGQLLFISTGNNLNWDGFTSAGEKAPNGTYFYTIEVADKRFNGTFSLFR